MSYFFNAPIQVPNGSNISLENTSGSKIFFASNSSMNANYGLVFPSSDGTSGQALVTDGSGNLRFDAVAGEVSSLASNAIVNSTSGDIVFTTDNGNVNIGTDNGNLTITTGTVNNDIQIITNDSPIFFSTNGNNASSIFDSSNITLLITNDNIGINSNLTVFKTASFSSTLDVTGQTNFNDTTQSTSTLTGALVVDGGVAVAKNLYVGENVVATSNVQAETLIGGDAGSTLIGNSVVGDLSLAVADTTGNIHFQAYQLLVGVDLNDYGLWSNPSNVSIGSPLIATSTLDVTNATTLNSTLAVTNATTLNGQTNINDKMVVAVDEFDSSVGTATDVWNGANTATNKHILTNTTGLSNYSSSGSYTTGQIMNVFFTNNTGGSSSANLDFGDLSLYTGSGTARYLLFNTTGQSASLVYINASGVNDGWRIVNTGAEVH